jgi:hypothetical protein
VLLPSELIPSARALRRDQAAVGLPQAQPAPALDDAPHAMDRDTEPAAQSLRRVARRQTEQQLVVLPAAERQIRPISGDRQIMARARNRGEVDLRAHPAAFQYMAQVREQPVADIDRGRRRTHLRQLASRGQARLRRHKTAHQVFARDPPRLKLTGHDTPS